MNRTIGLAILLVLNWFSTSHAMAKDGEQLMSDKHLHGIWLWRNTDYKETHDVELQHNDGKWSASVDKKDVALSENNGDISFSLGNGQRFEGKLADENVIEGTWFQPPVAFGYYAEMATIVSLPKTAENQWQYKIHIQPRPFHLFLDIYTDTEGQTKAVVRNPESNGILGSTLFDVVFVGRDDEKEHWQLLAKRTNREILVPFTFSPNQTITLEHSQIPHPASLTRSEVNELAFYYSRMPNTQNFDFQIVEDLNDGWQVADAVETGFDKKVLHALLEKLAVADPRSRRPQLLHSLLVSHKGTLVIEEYFYGHNKDTVHDTRSVGKVFGSVLMGAAQQQGYKITPLDTPLPDILSDAGLAVPDQKKTITLGHFLTHTSGLDAIEDQHSKGSEHELWQQQKENFWLYTAKLDVLHPPGERYAYASAGANMVGAALEKITGQTVRSFFHDAIAEPMNFAPYHWNLTPQGNSYLGGGVYMRPRDLLKIGALYAAQGKWQGQQLVPEQWVALSTQAKIPITPQTTGLSEEEFSNNYGGGSQAYIWLVSPIKADGRSYASYSATGNGGQMIVVVPELELAVGFTGGNYGMGGIWGRWRQQIIGDYLIPALIN